MRDFPWIPFFSPLACCPPPMAPNPPPSGCSIIKFMTLLHGKDNYFEVHRVLSELEISGGKCRAPPKAEKLVDHHLSVVRDFVAKYPDHPLVLMGKSMGSRVSCMVAATEDINFSVVICLGYPLKGTNGAVLDEILLQLKVPMMFIQGS